MNQVKVFSPATIANFIVGFDSLGAAIEPIDGSLLGDIVTIEKATQDSLEVKGHYKKDLPENNHDNLVMHCVNYFRKALLEKGMATDKLSICLEKGLPICSGLGSSAASIVATLTALNVYHDYPLSNQLLLSIAATMEGVVSGSPHYDNVLPAVLGGLQLMRSDGMANQLPWFDNLLIVLYYPGIRVSTKKAREILPSAFTLSNLTEYGQKFSGFIDSLYSHDQERAMLLLSDNLIEPHRGKLVPNFFLARDAVMQAGALAFGLSGSGPSCFALVDTAFSAQKIRDILSETMKGSETAFSSVVRIGKGAMIIDG